MSAAELGIRAAAGQAWRRFHAARLAEAACLALGAGLLTVAAAVLSGAAPRTAASLSVALLSALACGAAWWGGQRRSPLQVVRQLDTGLRRDGALVTAFECAGREDRGALEDLLLEREALELSPAAGRRAIAPPSVAFIAAPLIAAALLSVALEDRGAAPLSGPSAASALAGAGAALELITPGAQEAPSADSPGADLPGVDSPPAVPESARIEPAGGSPASTIEAAGALSDQQLAALGPGEATAEGQQAGSATAEPGLDTNTAAGSGSALAQDAAGSTMGGSALPGEHGMSPPPASTDETAQASGVLEGRELPGAAGPRAGEAGVLAGRWWPEHYDVIVRDWAAARAGDRRP